MQFADFDVDMFLRDHWQKRPLLIRNPWASWHNPLEPDDLAGLACEPDVEARLITRTRDSWTVEHGPFTESRFQSADTAPWTLLVQAVDHHAPDVAALLAPFGFIPNWRLDDIMVSYATDGGGVGPHFDHYDVFLVQGLGQRRWQVGARCDAATPLMPHDDLRLLAQFEATGEWLLDPGDILYVPPGFAHNGVAVGDDCMTYSVGLRAPSRLDLVAEWSGHLVDALTDDDRYGDPDLRQQGNPGEIAPAALARLHDMVMEAMGDREGFARWFGQYVSTRKYPDLQWQPERRLPIAQLRKRLGAGAALHRDPASRFAFLRQADGAVLLFADGQSFACTDRAVTLAERLCVNREIRVSSAECKSDAVIALLAQLIDQGSLAFDDED